MPRATLVVVWDIENSFSATFQLTSIRHHDKQKKPPRKNYIAKPAYIQADNRFMGAGDTFSSFVEVAEGGKLAFTPGRFAGQPAL